MRAARTALPVSVEDVTLQCCYRLERLVAPHTDGGPERVDARGVVDEPAGAAERAAASVTSILGFFRVLVFDVVS